MTSRRYALSKTYGINPSQLIKELNRNATTDPRKADGYSLVEVEVWSYGVQDLVDLVTKVNSSQIDVVSISEFLNCMKEAVLQDTLVGL